MKSRFRIKCGISQSIVRHHRFPTPSGHRTPIRYPTVIFSTHSRPAGSTRGLPPRISDPARVRTSRKAALPRTFAQHRRIHAPRTVQGTGTGLETEVVLPSRTHDFAANAVQFVYFHKKPVQIPLRRLEQTAVESERSSMHVVYSARTEQHLPLLRLQIGNSLLESAKPTLQILHT